MPTTSSVTAISGAVWELDGHLDTLRVPMLEGQRCEHDVVAQFAILDKYQRFWLDAPHRAIFGSGLSRSLRQLSQEWAASAPSKCGLAQHQ
jgi:hypothetical protein